MDYLWDKAGGSTSAMTARGLSYIDTITELENHRLLFAPEVEKTLSDQLRVRISKSDLLAQQKTDLKTIYTIVSFRIKFVLNK